MKKKSDDLLVNIVLEIKNEPEITEKNLAIKYCLSERTIRRYIKKLKIQGRIELINTGKKKKWKLIDKNFL